MSRLQNLKNKNKGGVYQRTVEEREPRNTNWFSLVMMLAVLGGLIYLIFFSNLFSIKNIEVRGYTHPESVKGIAEDMVSRNIFSKNVLFFSTRGLEKTLSGDSNISDVDVKRIYPNKIIIEVEESIASIVWETAGERYYIDNRGVVMGQAGDKILPVVSDAANINVESGKRVASPTFIKFINDISQDFQAATGSEIRKIIIMDILTDVHVLTSNGYFVYFDSSRTAEGQLKNLTRVLEEARRGKSKIQYIDMRLDNKIFYK